MKRPPALVVIALMLLMTLAIFSASRVLAQASRPVSAHTIEHGRTVFNSYCAHCHGEDAVAQDSFFDLPQLLSDRSDAFFFATVSNGIPDKGMPPWKNIIKHRDMVDMLIFLRSVERQQNIGGKGSGSD